MIRDILKIAATASRKLIALAVSCALIIPYPAFANPEGGVVQSGNANITSNGNKLDVHQQSDRVVIDWRTFNIDKGEHTQFHQPGSSSMALNRVGSGGASQILGTLSANGNIVIINPSGVFFGQGSVVDVNGLTATSVDINNNDFMSGNLRFNKPGNADAAITNYGTITAKEAGLVGLVAPNVSNHGVINAKLGKVHMASGDSFTLDMYGDGLMEIGVSDDVKSQIVSNTGVINAEGGTIAMTAAAGKKVVNSLINVEGELKAPAVAQRNGKIFIFAEGSNAVAGNNTADKGKKQGTSTVLVKGKLDASGYNAGGKGGDIQILADNVGILAGTNIDASGHAGGGSIKIGGDYLGKGTTPNAISTIIQNGTSIKANSINSGNGGKVIAWSDKNTIFSGKIEADAKGATGDGGFVETSGKEILQAFGTASAKSVGGNAGMWLLDPANVTISTSADSNIGGSPNFTPSGTGSIINVSSITSQLDAGTNVTITTGGDAFAGNGDITVSTAITTTGNGSLYLSAFRNIMVNAAVTLNGGTLTLQANNADTTNTGAGFINIASNITTNGGDIIIGGGADINTGYAIGNGTDLSGVYISASTINAGAGDITIRGQGKTNDNSTVGVYILNSSELKTTTGNISVTGRSVSTSGNANSTKGISFLYGTNKITSTSGNITLNGTAAGFGIGHNNVGIESYGTQITTGGSGTVTITGTGGKGTGANNNGVMLESGGTVTTADGDIIISGTATDTVSSTGTVMGSILQATGTGAISVTGTSSATGLGKGLYWTTYGKALTTSGNITLEGTGGKAVNANNSPGIYSYGNFQEIISTTGNILINGTGGGSSGNGYYNNGVQFISPITIQTGGNGTVTINGTGGIGSAGNNPGITFDSTSIIKTYDGLIKLNGITQDTSASYGLSLSGLRMESEGTGSIEVTGTAATNSSGNGLYIAQNTKLITTTGDITITGTGGLGANINTSKGIYAYGNGIELLTDSGDIILYGKGGGGSGTGYYNTGIEFASALNIITGGAGTITFTGVGGIGSTNNNHGINLSNGSIIQTEDGLLKFTGSANDTGSSYAVAITGATLQSTGTGNVEVTGTTLTSGQGKGIGFGANAKILTNTGDIIVTGTGGKGTNAINTHGIHAFGANQEFTSTLGNIILNGTGGGSGTGYYNYGLALELGASFTVGGSGNITLTGQGGTGTNHNNLGLVLTNVNVTAVDGDIELTGNGGGTGTSETGTTLSGTKLETTGTGNINVSGTGSTTSTGSSFGVSIAGNTIMKTVSGDITVNAQGGGLTSGGAGTTNEHGLYLYAASNTPTFTSTSGNITLNGTGGGMGTGSSNYGINFVSAANIVTGGSGSINITGTGGLGSGANNYGINFVSAGVTSADGDINITGTSRSGSSNTIGTNIYGPSTIQATGAGNINITGTASAAATTTDNYGLIFNTTNVAGSKVTVKTNTGQLKLVGNGGGGTSNNRGIYFYYVANGAYDILSTSGNIILQGTSKGTTTSNNGVSLSKANIVTGGAGTVTIEGTGSQLANGNSGFGIFFDYTNTVTTNTGAINLTGTSATGTSGSNGTTGNIGINFGSNTGTTTISSTSGNINLTGESKATAGNFGAGIQTRNSVISTGGAGKITLYGKSNSTAGTTNYGTYLNGSFTAGNGGIEVTGIGAGASSGAGIYLAGTISTDNSTGKIKFTGTNNGTGATNYGVQLASTGILNSYDGDIELIGTGGGTSSGYGVFLGGTTEAKNLGNVIVKGYGSTAGTTTANTGISGYDTTYSIKSKTGNITLEGTGGTGVNTSSSAWYNGNSGIILGGTGTKSITSQGGNISLTGTAGETTAGGYFNWGVSTDGTILTTGNGNLNITGISNATLGNSHRGIGMVSTGILKVENGTLTMNGTGGGTSYGAGISLAGTIEATGTGSLDITGRGSTVANTVNNNHGVFINDASIAIKSNTGDIGLTGIGGSGANTNTNSAYYYWGNSGIVFYGSGTRAITSQGGDIDIYGVSHSGATGDYAMGLRLDGTISTIGTGNINIEGDASSATSGRYTYGTALASNVSVVDGDISILGKGGGNSSFGEGINLYATNFTASGLGNINLTGHGSLTGTYQYNSGIYADQQTLSFSTNQGDIRMTGYGGAGNNTNTNTGHYYMGNAGIMLFGNGTRTITTTNGDIELKGYTSSLSNGYYNTALRADATITAGGNGNITILGDASAANTGTYTYGAIFSALNAVNGNISVTGKGGGNAIYGYGTNLNSNITITGAGNLDIFGYGSTNGTGSYNQGIYSQSQAFTLQTNSGYINLEGYGGTGNQTAINLNYAGNSGIYLNGNYARSITSSTGDIILKGESHANATGYFARGLDFGGNITTGGTGDITIEGTSYSTGIAGSGNGVVLTSNITAADGNISINGTGNGLADGWGTSFGNGTIKTTGAGNIDVIGTGSNIATGNSNHGIFSNGATLSFQSNTGYINLEGYGGSGSNTSAYGYNGSSGIWLAGNYPANRSITSTTGDIFLTGESHSGATGNYNRAIEIDISNITTGGDGNITLEGTSYAEGSYNYGIALDSAISSVDGDIYLKGIASGNNYGRGIVYTGAASASGTGNIDLIGYGSATATGLSNVGIYTYNTSQTLSTNTGYINLEGYGGTGDNTSAYVYNGAQGIYTEGTGTHSLTSNSGDISLYGESAISTTGNYNRGLSYGGTITTGGNGTINIEGVSKSNSGSGNFGLTYSGTMSTANGAINLTGTTTGAATGNGLNIGSSSNIYSTGGADINLTGNSATATDISTLTGTNIIGNTSYGSNITFNANSLSLANLAINSSSAGTVTFTPRTVGRTIGVAGGTGDLQVTAAILNMITAGKTKIGRSDGQGDINISTRTWTTDAEFVNGSGAINVNAAQTLTGKNLRAETTNGGNIALAAISANNILAYTHGSAAGDIIVNGVLTAVATGQALVLATGDDFTNNAGANALVTANGDWLVYMPDKTGNTLGGLTPAKTTYNCTYGGSCSIPSGDGFVYASSRGTITVIPVAVEVSYGDVATYTYEIIGYDTGDEDLDNLTGSLTFGSSYAQGDNAGSIYDINYISGTLTSELGYTLDYSNLQNGLTVVKKDITATYNSALSKTYGDANPGDLLLADFSFSGLYNANDKNVFVVTTDFGGIDANTNAGNHTISASIDGGANYNISSIDPIDLVINKRNLTISTDDKSKTYGDADPSFTGSNNLTAYDAGLLVLTYGAQSYSGDAGTYTIGYNIGANGERLDNYNITEDFGTLTVDKRNATISVDDKTKTYGDANPTYTGSNDLLSGDASQITWGYDPQNYNGDAGTYDIELNAIDSNNRLANYNITYDNGTLTVDKRNATVTVDDKNKTYGDVDPTFTGSNTLLGSDASQITWGYNPQGYSDNAGSYAINASATDTNNRLANYNITYNNGTLTVDKRNATVTVDDKNKIYGDANPTYTGSSDILAGDASQITWAYDPQNYNGDAGTYTITASATDSNNRLDNYNLTYDNGTLTVDKRNATVTVDDKNKIYGDANPTYTGSSDILAGDASQITWAYDPQNYNGDAGSYDITASATDANNRLANYNITFENGILTVDKRNATITVDDKSKTYGDTDPAFSNSNNLLGSDASQITWGYNAQGYSGNAGTYDVSTTATDTNNRLANYNITYVDGELTVNKRNATVTVDDKTKTYGDTNPTYTGSNDILSGDASQITWAYDPQNYNGDAGTYDIFVTATDTNNRLDNYNITYDNGQLTVNKRNATVTVDDKTKTYGSTEPTFTNSNNLIGSDASQITWAYDPQNYNGDVGTYNVSTSATDANNRLANYNLTYVDGTLTVDKKSIIITVDDKTKTYGDSDPALTGSNNLEAADAAQVTWSYLVDNYNGDAGIYSILASATDTNNRLANYDITYDNGTLTVDKRNVTVTVDDKTKTYGDANPTYTGSNDILGSDASQISWIYNPQSYSGDAGTYSITASATDANNRLANYNVTYDNGTLTVNKRNATVIVDDKTKTYGDSDPIFTGSSDILGSDASQITWGYNPQGYSGNAGSYAINASATDTNNRLANYNLTYDNGTLTVDKRNATVIVDNKSKTYGDANPTYTGSNNLLSGDASQVTWGYSPQSYNGDAGTYNINASATDTNNVLDNYNITFQNGILTVNKRNATIVADNKTKTYGDANPTYTGSNNLLAGDASQITWGYSPQSYSGDAGTYTITTTATDANNRLDNYNITFTNGQLTVNKRNATVIVDNKTKTYGDTDPAFTGSNNLLAGDANQITWGYNPQSYSGNAGTYSVTAAANDNNNRLANYNVTYQNGTLNVGKRDLTVTADNKSITGGSTPSFTASYSGFVNNDNASVFTAGPSFFTSASNYNTAGTYSISASGIQAANYNFLYNNGILTITSMVAPAITNPPAAVEKSPVSTFFAEQLNNTQPSVLLHHEQSTFSKPSIYMNVSKLNDNKKPAPLAPSINSNVGNFIFDAPEHQEEHELEPGSGSRESLNHTDIHCSKTGLMPCSTL